MQNVAGMNWPQSVADLRSMCPGEVSRGFKHRFDSGEYFLKTPINIDKNTFQLKLL